MSLIEAIDAAREWSKKGYVQHVNLTPGSRTDYYVSDWYCDATVASYENGKRL